MSTYKLSDVTALNGSQVVQINNSDSVLGALAGSFVQIGTEQIVFLDSVDIENSQIVLTTPWQYADAVNVECTIGPMTQISSILSLISKTNDVLNKAKELAKKSTVFSYSSVDSLSQAFLDGTLLPGSKAITDGFYEGSVRGGATYYLKDATVSEARPSANSRKYIHVGDGGLYLETAFNDGSGFATQFGVSADSDIGAALTAAQESLKKINLDEMEFISETPILVNEGLRLVGAGAQIPRDEYNSGTKIVNNTSNATISVQGTWYGFDSRRFIELSEFSILSPGEVDEQGELIANAPATIHCDFLTIFDLRKIIIYGVSNYHLQLVNSYNGTLRDSRFYGAKVANMYITTDPSASVFSGQMLFENVDFWSANNDTNDAAGTIIDKTANLMEQINFTKCHWQDCDIGFWVKAGGDKTIVSAHFEANHQYDLLVEANADNPKILSGFCNNALTTLASFKLGGRDGCIKQFDFINIDNDAWCIDITNTCDGLVIDGITMTQKSGAETNGIRVAGQNITLHNIKCFTGGSAGSWNVITFTPEAKNIYIKNVMYDNFGPAVPMVDEGATNLVFEGSQTFISAEFSLNAGSVDDTVFTDIQGYVNRAWLIYTSAAGAGSATINVGRSTEAGSRDYPRYVAHTTTPNAAQHTREALEISATAYISKTDALVFRCSGDSAGAGNVKVVVEITPYRALT